MSYQIEWNANTVIWTYTGRLTGEELLQSNMEIYGDERFDNLRYQIVDLRAVEAFVVDDHHMRKIAHLDRAAAYTNPKIRVAVVTRDQTGESMTDTYIAQSPESHWPTQTFYDFDEAARWVRSNDK